MKLYPLKFIPIFSYRIWGGKKLKTVLNKEYDQDNIGESWEISDVKDNETLVSDGALKGKSLQELMHHFKADLVGNKVYENFGNEFPLLIKFIDADKPLSIQVHPNNKLAKERHNSFGKNEMWYVMEAEENAELIVGFNKKTEKKSYLHHVNNNTVPSILNIEKVKSGDTFYIPTGKIHAIGAGVLLAEIQQTSNITYRIYDYDRVDVSTGKKRDLHNDLAIDAIDFNFTENHKTIYDLKTNDSEKLVHCPYFKTNLIHINKEVYRDLKPLDSFVIYICVEGNATLMVENNTYTLSYGETILIPAVISAVELTSKKAKILEVYL